MYSQQLILEAHFVDYDDDISFTIKAKNESCSALLDFYGTSREFADFGAELINFPRSINHEAHYPPRDSYAENTLYAYFLTIRAFCYDPAGHAALEIRISNPGSPPNSYQANFYIHTDVASLNRLGQKLAGWNVEERAKVPLYDEE